jgi:hypothetical protein
MGGHHDQVAALLFFGGPNDAFAGRIAFVQDEIAGNTLALRGFGSGL